MALVAPVAPVAEPESRLSRSVLQLQHAVCLARLDPSPQGRLRL